MSRAPWESVVHWAIRAVLDRDIPRRRAKDRQSSARRSWRQAHPIEQIEPRYLLTAPLVGSIDRTTPTGPITGASSVEYTVTFDSSVTGVDATDFKVFLAGSVRATTPVVVSGGGAVYSVTINGIRGTGDLRLDLIDNDSIIAAGEPLGDWGPHNGSFQGEGYTVLQVYPAVLSISRTTPAGPLTTATSVEYTVTFNKDVTGVDAGDFQVVLGGVTTSPPIVSGSGAIYTVTINNIAGVGSVGLNFVDNGSVHDLSGLPLQSRGQASFQSPATFATSTNNRILLAADLNGDTYPDLVLADTPQAPTFSRVTVLLGNGDGTFQNQTTFNAGTPVMSLHIADLSGDGIPDLVVFDPDNDFGDLRLGNGDGTFQSPTGFAHNPRNPSFAVFADVNVDGRLDLLSTTGSSIGLLLGNGSTSFQPKVTFATGGGGRHFAVGDVNGDQKPDVVFQNNNTNTVGVLLGNGNGTFQNFTTIGSVSAPEYVAIADLNGDGKADVAVARAGSSPGISVLFGNGNGTFQTSTSWATAYAATSISTADMNGDGVHDIVASGLTATNSSALDVFLSNGNGTFLSSRVYSTNATIIGFAAMDLNGDGRPDMIYTGPSTSHLDVRLANGTSPFTGQVYSFIHELAVQSINRTTPSGPATNATSVTYTVTFSQPVTGVDATDFKLLTTGGVQATLPVVVSGSGSVYTVSVNGIRGTGDLSLDLIDDDSIANGPTPLGGPGMNNGSFQGQEYTILQAGPRLLSINRATPGTQLTNSSTVTYTVTFDSNVTGVDAGDFQLALSGVTASAPLVTGGDSVYTVTINGIAGVGTLGLNLADNASIRDITGNPLQRVTGFFQTQTTFATGVNPSPVVAADLNGDGKADLVVLNRSNGPFPLSTLSVRIGNGDGTFQNQIVVDSAGQITSIAVDDVNGDGILDLIGNIYVGSPAMMVRLGNGDGTFQNPHTFTTAPFPEFVLPVDVNGDGKLDLAVADNDHFTTSLNGVNVMLNNGDGTFQSQTPYTFATGLRPTSIASADLNGDGKPDLVVANSDSGNVSVLLGNGDGSFQGQTTFAAGPGPQSVVTADVNADGKYDLIVANRTNANVVSVLLGNGNGTFQNQITFAGGQNPYEVVAADVSGDGKLDLLIANLNDQSVSMLLGNGNGTFQSQVTFAVGFGSGSADVADVNGDGRPDLIVANGGANNVSVLLASQTVVGQTFTIDTVAPIITLTAPVNNSSSSNTTPTFSGAAGNLSGDSTTVTVRIYSGTSTAGTLVQTVNTTRSGATYSAPAFPGLPAGTFTAQASQSDTAGNVGTSSTTVFTIFPVVQSISRATPTGPFTSASSVTYTVNFNTSVIGVDGSDFQVFTAGSLQTSPIVGVSGSSNTYTITINGIVGNGEVRLDLIDDDSITSLGLALATTGTGNGSFQGQSYSVLQAYPYVLSVNRTTPSGSLTNANSVTYTVTFSTSVTGVDASDFELVLSGVNASVPLVSGSGAVYTVTINGITGDGTLGLNLIDDGSIQNAVGYPLRGGPVSLQSQGTIATGEAPNSVVTADVNGDGLPDLIVANLSSNSLSVMLGNGNGTFQSQTTFATATAPYSVTTADVNGDGKPDLVAANYGTSNVSVLLGNGDGTFQSQTTFTSGSGPRSITMADVNNDGKADLIVVNSNNNNVGVRLGNGNGTFQAQSNFNTGQFPRFVAVGDVNGDGAQDLIVANQNSKNVSVLRGNGNGTFQTQTTVAAGVTPLAVSTADVNGDSKLDLIVANENSRNVSVLVGNGNGTFLAQVTYATESLPLALTTADVNGDGKIDLIVAAANDSVSILLGNGDGTFRTPITFATGSIPSSVIAADVNADGRSDIFTANFIDNSISVLFGSGTGDFTGQTYTLDNTAPTLVASSFHYDTGHRILLSFSENVSPGLSTSSIAVSSTPGGSPITVTGYAYDPQANTATFTLPTSLPDGNYIATWQPANFVDLVGNQLASPGSLSFFVYAGDADHNREIDARDFLIVATNWLSSGKTFSQGDFNYDGLVNQIDLTVLAQKWQQSLAQPAPPLPSTSVVTSARQPVRTPTRTPLRVIDLVP